MAHAVLNGAPSVPSRHEGIRNWKDLVLYRSDSKAKYRHIDKLFTATIDWVLIEPHWQELMQVALSIQAGTISSPPVLRRLGSESRKNRLCLAARELGNVVRTVFLLEWVGSLELRQEVTANTNKIESYNGFSKWRSFGGDVIAENEPDEQQKRLRYNDLVATIPEQVLAALDLIDDFIAELTRVRTFLEPLEALSLNDDCGDVLETSSSTVRRVGRRPAKNGPPSLLVNERLSVRSADIAVVRPLGRPRAAMPSRDARFQFSRLVKVSGRFCPVGGHRACASARSMPAIAASTYALKLESMAASVPFCQRTINDLFAIAGRYLASVGNSSARIEFTFSCSCAAHPAGSSVGIEANSSVENPTIVAITTLYESTI
ncbi:MAG TPA: Tn3 family transposase [Paraburkholderia sp.]